MNFQEAQHYTEKISIDPILAGETREIDLTPLPANARCFYRIHHRALNTNLCFLKIRRS